jgi:hypothetical protein
MPDWGRCVLRERLVGSCGIFSCAVCVDCRVDPSGSRTEMLELATRLLLYGALLVMKWLVAPVLATITGAGSNFGREGALPPILLSLVACSMWPSSRCLQVLLVCHKLRVTPWVQQ